MARETKTITLVNCAKFDAELPALARPPFPGELGQRIYEEISALAWGMWKEQSSLLINHYGLNMADPKSNEFLFEHMEKYLFDEGADPSALGGAPSKSKK